MLPNALDGRRTENAVRSVSDAATVTEEAVEAGTDAEEMREVVMVAAGTREGATDAEEMNEAVTVVAGMRKIVTDAAVTEEFAVTAKNATAESGMSAAVTVAGNAGTISSKQSFHESEGGIECA